MRFARLLLPCCLLAQAPLAIAQAEALQKCRAERDAALRLACYDAIPATAAAPAAAAGNAPAPAKAAAPAAATNFGLPAANQGGDAIDSRIAGVVEGWGPRTQFRLANGQVWQVEDGSSAALYLREPKVRVRRGFAGAYYLELEGSNRSPRVRRLQ